MKILSPKATHVFNLKSFIGICILLILLSIYSCSDSKACEEDNTGTLIIENTKSTGVLKIFFNREPASSNVSGDLNIEPGEKVRKQHLAGQITIFALLDLSYCTNGGCVIQNEELPEKMVNLDPCDEINIVY